MSILGLLTVINLIYKMIKKFKLFENYDSVSQKLVDQFDEEFVESYFLEHFDLEAYDIIDRYPYMIWNHIDDDDYVSDVIANDISQSTIEDFDKNDYINYLKNIITDDQHQDIENKIVKLYNKKKKTTDDSYDDDMLDELSETQLRKIIKDDDEEEFVRYIIEEKYEGDDAKDIASEIYDMNDGNQLYNAFSYYIDEDALHNDWLDDVNKREELQNEIFRRKSLQKKLLAIKKSNALLLAKLFVENSHDNDDSISNKYKFQKIYINQYIKKNIGEKSENELKAEAIKFLYENFKLNAAIEEEYKDDMWLISSGKFNL